MFRGGYTPDIQKLTERKYIIAKQPKMLITVLNDDQGFGRVMGVIKKEENTYPDVDVAIYKRTDKTLLWVTTSNNEGKYVFRNLSVGLECFVIAIDPNNQYNAIIQDKVIPVSGFK